MRKNILKAKQRYFSSESQNVKGDSIRTALAREMKRDREKERVNDRERKIEAYRERTMCDNSF